MHPLPDLLTCSTDTLIKSPFTTTEPLPPTPLSQRRAKCDGPKQRLALRHVPLHPTTSLIQYLQAPPQLVLGHRQRRNNADRPAELSEGYEITIQAQLECLGAQGSTDVGRDEVEAEHEPSTAHLRDKVVFRFQLPSQLTFLACYT